MIDDNIIFPVDFQTLLTNRRLATVPLNAIEYEKKVELYVTTKYGTYMCTLAKGTSEYNEYITKYETYINRLDVIRKFDHRVVTHNFADSSSWVNGTNDSTFTIKPDDGKIYAITSILVRFPKDLKLKKGNELTFKVFLSPDGINPPDYNNPKIFIQYSSLKDLSKKSNNPLNAMSIIIDDLSNKEMCEITFHYANQDTLEGSPLILHSNLNEKIEIYLVNHEPVKDVLDQSYLPEDAECWAVANGKQYIEF